MICVFPLRTTSHLLRLLFNPRPGLLLFDYLLRPERSLGDIQNLVLTFYFISEIFQSVFRWFPYTLIYWYSMSDQSSDNTIVSVLRYSRTGPSTNPLSHDDFLNFPKLLTPLFLLFPLLFHFLSIPNVEWFVFLFLYSGHSVTPPSSFLVKPLRENFCGVKLHSYHNIGSTLWKTSPVSFTLVRSHFYLIFSNTYPQLQYIQISLINLFLKSPIPDSSNTLKSLCVVSKTKITVW